MKDMSLLKRALSYQTQTLARRNLAATCPAMRLRILPK